MRNIEKGIEINEDTGMACILTYCSSKAKIRAFTTEINTQKKRQVTVSPGIYPGFCHPPQSENNIVKYLFCKFTVKYEICSSVPGRPDDPS
jgi:hypothetical protein